MLKILLKIIPDPIKVFLRLLKKSLITPVQKKLLVKKMQIKHKKLLEDVKHKKKVKVVFLELFKGMWKLDPVFKKMLEDPYFEPIILVCPCISYGDNAMWVGMQETYSFFQEKGYPVLSAYKEKEERWIELSEINPDIIFFSIPHNMTKKEYYSEGYLNYLSCYVPYHHEVGSYANNISQYDEFFHNAQWKIFVSHEYSLDVYKKVSHTQGKNVIVTGYPMMEEFFIDKTVSNIVSSSSWKTSDNRLKIIWAPHHTIDTDYLPYSNFLEYAESFKSISQKYKDQIVWSFKPHPELKPKLYNHSDWGKERTDDYFSYWEKQEFTQLNLGEYISLFQESDAMIHDSGSFLAEYLYIRKPVLYMLNKNNNTSYYNIFGLKALMSCRVSTNLSELEEFIEGVARGDISEITSEHILFYDRELLPYFKENSPSKTILSMIKENISNAI